MQLIAREPATGGTYEALLPFSETRTLLGVEICFVDLETLIRLERAVGSPKDFERVADA